MTTSVPSLNFSANSARVSPRPLRLKAFPRPENQDTLTAEHAKESRGVRREIQIEPPAEDRNAIRTAIHIFMICDAMICDAPVKP